MKTTLHRGFRALGQGLMLLAVAMAAVQVQAAEFYLGGGIARHAVDGGFDGKTAYTTTFIDSNESVLVGKIQPGNGPMLELGIWGENHVFGDLETSRTFHRATHYLSNSDSEGTVTETALTLGYAYPLTSAVNLYAGFGLASYNVALTHYYQSTQGKHYVVNFKGPSADSLQTPRFTAGVWYRSQNSLSVRAGVARGSALFTSASAHDANLPLKPSINADIYTADISVLYMFSQAH